MLEIRQTAAYAQWFKGLRDRQARVRIQSRIDRLSLGNPTQDHDIQTALTLARNL